MKKSDNETKKISVYTTRIDTVFGMTYAVIMSDYQNISDFITHEQKDICERYIKESTKKSIQNNQEKTGVFTGSYVINPFNNEQIPLWISNYINDNCSTGAAMAVPAHDTKDFEFAQKYGLEIKQSIGDIIRGFSEGENLPIKGKKGVYKNGITAILLDENEENILLLHYPNQWIGLITGGVDEGYSFEETLLKEIEEETGYNDISIIQILNNHYQEYYHEFKDINGFGTNRVYVTKLASKQQSKISELELKKHIPKWHSLKTAGDKIYFENHKNFLESYLANTQILPMTNYGTLVDSGDFSGLSSEEAQGKLITFAEKQGFGKHR